jgi:hypothetical protein
MEARWQVRALHGHTADGELQVVVAVGQQSLDTHGRFELGASCAVAEVAHTKMSKELRK